MNNKPMRKFRFDSRKLVDLSMEDYLLCDPEDAYNPSDITEWIVPEPKQEVYLALQGLPHILEHLCRCYPEQADRLQDGVQAFEDASPNEIEGARDKLLHYSSNFVMVKDSAAYDASIRHAWNLFDVVDEDAIQDRVVADVGAGTGVVTWKCCFYAKKVYAIEPVRRLREYISRKAQAHGIDYVEVLSGTLESIPLGDKSVDTVIAAFVVSSGWLEDRIRVALRETERVTKEEHTIAFIVPALRDAVCEKTFAERDYCKFVMQTPCDGDVMVFRKTSASRPCSGQTA